MILLQSRPSFTSVLVAVAPVKTIPCIQLEKLRYIITLYDYKIISAKLVAQLHSKQNFLHKIIHM